jgi:glycerol-3-phosphate dehydrogenase
MKKSNKAEHEHFDVIVVGGGINGAGVARDCALRGLKVLILDKNDFASGTSSRSTKLVHGGIRYLEHFEFGLVWEACHERKILTQIAPQLVRVMPFIIPVYKGDKRPAWLVKLGMFLYDLMAGFKNIHWHKNLSAKKILKLLPGIKKEGLKGGGVYYDCQTKDARLTLANIQDAVAHSATAKNYTEVATVNAHENGLEVTCQDVLTAEKFTYTTSYIVNATGPWLDINLAKWHLDNTKHLRLTKGIHFFIPKLEDKYAILIGSQRDERVFFVIPWNDHSLVGTTDTDYKGNPDNVGVEDKDIKYLLDELSRLFPDKKLSKDDVSGEYAGLRALLHTEGVKEGAVTREYKLSETRRGDSVILSVIGGKLTTYRSLAEKITNKIVRELHNGKNRSETSKMRLPGSDFKEDTLDEFIHRALKENHQLASIPRTIAENLLQTYGSAIDQVLPYLKREKTAEQPAGLTKIIPEMPIVWGQLYYGIEHEYIKTAEDFINRRTELYIHSGKQPGLRLEIAEVLGE